MENGYKISPLSKNIKIWFLSKVECKKAQAKDIMPLAGKKGGKHDSRGPSDHSRHGGVIDYFSLKRKIM